MQGTSEGKSAIAKYSVLIKSNCGASSCEFGQKTSSPAILRKDHGLKSKSLKPLTTTLMPRMECKTQLNSVQETKDKIHFLYVCVFNSRRVCSCYQNLCGWKKNTAPSPVSLCLYFHPSPSVLSYCCWELNISSFCCYIIKAQNKTEQGTFFVRRIKRVCLICTSRKRQSKMSDKKFKIKNTASCCDFGNSCSPNETQSQAEMFTSL